ncbi:MAG: hypothetical protein LBT79_05455 [Elusimicrobiota bacterium]|jgi:uncharacterized protein (UPF0333 family)|nr:hypothetical protein [Elusimicrobiota bacterium]
MKSNKGQIFVEFILVVVVLFAVTAGLYSLYKSSWQKKYKQAAGQTGVSAVATSIPGGYVK